MLDPDFVPLPSMGRWLQLCLGVVCMVLIANLQYAWALFVEPIHVARGWSLAEKSTWKRATFRSILCSA